MSTAPRATFPCARLTSFSGTTCLVRPTLPANVNLLLQDLPHRLHGFGFGFYLELNLGRRREALG